MRRALVSCAWNREAQATDYHLRIEDTPAWVEAFDAVWCHAVCIPLSKLSEGAYWLYKRTEERAKLGPVTEQLWGGVQLTEHKAAMLHFTRRLEDARVLKTQIPLSEEAAHKLEPAFVDRQKETEADLIADMEAEEAEASSTPD